MQITEKTYEEVLYKLLITICLEGTSPQAGYTKEQIFERLKDWFENNAPIGAMTLLQAARLFDRK